MIKTQTLQIYAFVRHRNDMIRFGKYEGAWGFKTNNDVYRRIFPIPNTALLLNPKLTQNAGY